MKHWSIALSLLLVSSQLAAKPLLPGNLFTRNVDSAQAMVINKQTRTGSLVVVENDQPRLLRQFDDLQFGKNSGDKQREGDKRTPEGVYRITRFIPDEQLDSIYGSGAFPIDYPNPLDRVEGRKGSGIWLHGRAYNDPDKSVTRGCVAFRNEEIRELQPQLTPGTQVIITRSTELLDSASYQRERQRLVAAFDDFIGSWQRGDLQELSQSLHPDFRSGGLNRAAWINRKQQIFASHPQRDIRSERLLILKEDGNQVVYDFTQTYCADNLLSRGHKRLYFKNDAGQLRLVTERYRGLPVDHYIKAELRGFLDSWLSSWRQLDAKAYLALYADDFRDDRGRDLGQWRSYKTGLFGSGGKPEIKVSDLKLDNLGNNRYQLSFRQDYRRGDYSDLGIKKLLLRGCPGSLRIVSESWKRLSPATRLARAETRR